MINALKNIIVKKAALITGCFFVWGCSNDFQQVRDMGKKKQGRDEAYTVTAYMSEGAKQKAKLIAPKMIQITADTNKMIFPETLHVEFFDDSAKAESWLFAKYAVNYINMGKVWLRDSVVVYNIKGDTLHTTELWWDSNRQIFYNNKKVRILQKNGTDLTGDSLLSDQAFKNVRIFKTNGLMVVQDSTMPK